MTVHKLRIATRIRRRLRVRLRTEKTDERLVKCNSSRIISFIAGMISIVRPSKTRMTTNGQQIVSESKLNNLHRELGRAQDEFYSRFTEWNVSGQKSGSGRRCHDLALAYLDVIDRFLECLKQETASSEIAREIQNAGEWRSILSSDLNYLARFGFHGPKLQTTEPLDQSRRPDSFISGSGSIDPS